MPASVRATATALIDASGSVNVNKPAGTAQNDILLAFHSVDAGTLAQMGTPTGGATWLSLGTRNSGTGTDNKTKVWWKVAGGSEPSTYGFTQNSAATGVLAVTAVMGANTALTPVITQTGNDTAATTVPTPGLTPAGVDDLELRWASGFPDGEVLAWTSPATYTELADLQSAGGNRHGGSLAAKQLTSGAATGSLNFTASVSISFRHGFTVAVASAAVALARRPFIATAAKVRAANW